MQYKIKTGRQIISLVTEMKIDKELPYNSTLI